MEPVYENINEVRIYQENDFSLDVYDKTLSLFILLQNGESLLNKKIAIINKLLMNISENPKDEKFRKIKLENENIKFLFSSDSGIIYEFILYLGFEEKFLDGDLCLYFSKEEELEKLNTVASYLNLLISDFEESEAKEVLRYPELSNSDQDINNYKQNNISGLPSYEDLNKQNILDILKESRASRMTSNDNKFWFENNTNNHQSKSKKDIKTILKETAAIRRNNSDYFQNSYNYKPNTSHQFLEKSTSQDKKFMSLSDISYSNPQKNDKVIKEEIGRKCLIMTNEFRIKHKLEPLQWDNQIWQVSYEHSVNMGKYIVKFGHDGFNQRVSRLPHRGANENVFMCRGVSEYEVASLGVNGWINSPGHRKNLLSQTTHCAIATFRNDIGEYFLTQIFTKKY